MSFGGFGGFGQNNNNQQQQNTGFGGFGSTTNTNTGRSISCTPSTCIAPGATLGLEDWETRHESITYSNLLYLVQALDLQAIPAVSEARTQQVVDSLAEVLLVASEVLEVCRHCSIPSGRFCSTRSCMVLSRTYMLKSACYSGDFCLHNISIFENQCSCNGPTSSSL